MYLPLQTDAVPRKSTGRVGFRDNSFGGIVPSNEPPGKVPMLRPGKVTQALSICPGGYMCGCSEGWKCCLTGETCCCGTSGSPLCVDGPCNG